MKTNEEFLSNLRSITLLIVEDTKEIREELAFFLESKVKILYAAQNGEEGLELYKKYKPDIVISDIRMPQLDGIKMCKEIKSYNKDAKIILTTAYNESNYFLEAIKIHINDYLIKPIDLNELFDILCELSKGIILEKFNHEVLNTLQQYKDIVDERSIVSKTDINGIITYVNRPFEEISGYKKEELIGKPHSIIRHKTMKSETFKDMWETILSKKSWHGVVKNRKKNGSYYIVDSIIKPILDVNGNIIEFIALRNDITELEESKEFFKYQNEKNISNLKESIRKEKLYREAVDKANIIIRLSRDMKFLYVNEAFCEISGYSKLELIGESYDKIRDKRISYDEYIKHVEEVRECLYRDDFYKGEITNQKKDGSLFFCKYMLFPIKDAKGEICEYLSIRHDITEIKSLHKELEDTQREIIYKLGEVGETRSKETGNHVKRVAEYSKLLAEKAGLNNEEINTLFTASPMHDIGKVGIPDTILNKPGKLDAKEWGVMQTHSEIGYNILKTSTRPILKAAAIISYTHHEKWDGSGYPRGLKGEDIHIFGRITAIADVFDALGSDRCYKKAWPLEDILLLVTKESGKHFDPNLVELFMTNLEEFLAIRDLYKD
ncbi:regulator [Halarcobacter ebronensis]|uniref:Regulator n=1 Tax=Halarcobacter ebronensis TaxID=1462615 RepID=A0A4V1LR52_9BACT|nr:PAS domain S-box protein [Halarcobacter ebronensis]RXJ66988.1 regulator [Halarcobacter ebronensis]